MHDKVEFHDIDSSNLHQIGYNPETQELHVKFKSGTYGTYAPIPREDYHALLTTTESKGSFFHNQIKLNPDYKFTKIK